jgi:hypothetical protein
MVTWEFYVVASKFSSQGLCSLNIIGVITVNSYSCYYIDFFISDCIDLGSISKKSSQFMLEKEIYVT